MTLLNDVQSRLTRAVGSGISCAPTGLKWLPGLDSNQGLQLQRLTCYRYTTGQRRVTLQI